MINNPELFETEPVTETPPSTINVDVATFNVLSSLLCSGDELDRCDSADLVAGTRRRRIFSLLTKWMNEKRIIALQELDDIWNGPIEIFMRRNGYEFYMCQYGKSGVGIAYPAELFDIEECNRFTPGEAIGNIKINGLNLYEASRAPTLPGFTHSEITSHVKDLFDASKKNNKCLSLHLRSKANEDMEFWVCTYHMPCKFRQPVLMYSHLMAISSHMNYIKRNCPILFMGDLNTKPSDIGYKIMVERFTPPEMVKIMNNSERAYPFRSPEGVAYDPSVNMANFKSTHAELHGTEPEFTNVWITSERRFVDTLDYVLCSEELIPIECKIDEETLTGSIITDRESHEIRPFPTRYCPSDHLPLLASFILSTPLM